MPRSTCVPLQQNHATTALGGNHPLATALNQHFREILRLFRRKSPQILPILPNRPKSRLKSAQKRPKSAHALAVPAQSVHCLVGGSVPTNHLKIALIPLIPVRERLIRCQRAESFFSECLSISKPTKSAKNTLDQECLLPLNH